MKAFPLVKLACAIAYFLCEFNIKTAYYIIPLQKFIFCDKIIKIVEVLTTMKNRYRKTLTKIAKTAVVVSLFILCLILPACDPSHYYFENTDFDGAVSIELINYANPEQRYFRSWVPDHTSDLKAFDNSKETFLENLDDSKTTDFIDRLCKCMILSRYYAYDSPDGICIKVNYADGDFLIIWSNYQIGTYAGYIGKFKSDGTVSTFIGCFCDLGSYLDLVNEYFHTQI